MLWYCNIHYILQYTLYNRRTMQAMLGWCFLNKVHQSPYLRVFGGYLVWRLTGERICYLYVYNRMRMMQDRHRMTALNIPPSLPIIPCTIILCDPGYDCMTLFFPIKHHLDLADLPHSSPHSSCWDRDPRPRVHEPSLYSMLGWQKYRRQRGEVWKVRCKSDSKGNTLGQVRLTLDWLF